MWEGGVPHLSRPARPRCLGISVHPAAGTCVQLDFCAGERGWDRTERTQMPMAWGRLQHRCPPTLPAVLGRGMLGGVKAPSPTRPKPAAARAQVVLAKPRSRRWELNSSLLWQAEE